MEAGLLLIAEAELTGSNGSELLFPSQWDNGDGRDDDDGVDDGVDDGAGEAVWEAGKGAVFAWCETMDSELKPSTTEGCRVMKEVCSPWPAAVHTPLACLEGCCPEWCLV